MCMCNRGMSDGKCLYHDKQDRDARKLENPYISRHVSIERDLNNGYLGSMQKSTLMNEYLHGPDPRDCYMDGCDGTLWYRPGPSIMTCDKCSTSFTNQGIML